jgi:hypothetical protein
VEIPSLEWRIWPARQEPRRAVVVGGIIAAAAAGAGALFSNPLPGVAAAGLLAGAVGEFLFPTWYRLTPAGAEARNPVFWRRIAWGEVKQVYVGEQEIKLSPLPAGGRREAFRGVLLRLDENRDAVLAAIERFRDAAAGD